MDSDVIQLLKKDHENLNNMLDELTGTTNRASKKRQELLQKVTRELEIHTKVEEEIVYPAFKQAAQEKEVNQMYYEAKEEHRAVEALVIPDLEKTEVTSDEFAGRAKVLKDMIEHHVEEEEEEMFPKMAEIFSKEQLRDLGRQAQAMRQQMQ